MAGLRTALVKLLAREDREFQRQSIRRIVCSFSSNANRHKVCWLSSKGINISPRGGKREPNAILAQYLVFRWSDCPALWHLVELVLVPCVLAGLAPSDAQSASLAF